VIGYVIGTLYRGRSEGGPEPISVSQVHGAQAKRMKPIGLLSHVLEPLAHGNRLGGLHRARSLPLRNPARAGLGSSSPDPAAAHVCGFGVWIVAMRFQARLYLPITAAALGFAVAQPCRCLAWLVESELRRRPGDVWQAGPSAGGLDLVMLSKAWNQPGSLLLTRFGLRSQCDLFLLLTRDPRADRGTAASCVGARRVLELWFMSMLHLTLMHC